MKQQNKEDRVEIGWLFGLINYFFIALYLKLIPTTVVVVQNFYQLLRTILYCNCQSCSPIVVYLRSICPFNQQQLHHVLFALSRCHNQWSLAFRVLGLKIRTHSYQIRDNIGESLGGSQVEDRI